MQMDRSGNSGAGNLTSEKAPAKRQPHRTGEDVRTFQEDLRALSGRDIVSRILDSSHPRALVQGLPPEDFYWMIKKIGEEDSLLLLQMASYDQWQYALDLELWNKDRLDGEATALWLKRLQEADCNRLVRWLFTEGEYLTYLHLFRSLDVVVLSDKDDIYELPGDFFSPDGTLHLRVRDPSHRESLESIIRTMAATDFERYQSVILGLTGVLQAEVEEELYRRKTVRLAEHGFLPYEEAVSIYTPLDRDWFAKENPARLTDADPEDHSLVPLSPFQHIEGATLLTEAATGMSDPLLTDRLNLEFAGLCNQILVADGLSGRDLDELIKTSRKGAGHVNVALESLCGRDLLKARALLQGHSLVSLFRMGFGLVLKLRWEAERWIKGCWFRRMGLPFVFWGDRWGGTLAGLMEKRPRYYAGLEEGRTWRDFERVAEVAECTAVLRHIMVLDALMEALFRQDAFGLEGLLHLPEPNVRPVLFTLWGGKRLGLESEFRGLTLKQVLTLLHGLRGDGAHPPYRMPAGMEDFVQTYLDQAQESDSDAVTLLRETLILLWMEFQEEYERVPLEDLDPRYLRYFVIRAPSGEGDRTSPARPSSP